MRWGGYTEDWPLIALRYAYCVPRGLGEPTLRLLVCDLHHEFIELLPAASWFAPERGRSSFVRAVRLHAAGVRARSRLALSGSVRISGRPRAIRPPEPPPPHRLSSASRGGIPFCRPRHAALHGVHHETTDRRFLARHGAP